MKSLQKNLIIAVAIVGALRATPLHAQNIAEYLQTARAAYENGDYRTVLTSVAKIEEAVGSKTKPATAYLRIMSHYKLQEYDNCISAANDYLSAQPAQDGTLQEIKTALENSQKALVQQKEQARQREIAAREAEQAARQKREQFVQDQAAAWEKIKNTDNPDVIKAWYKQYPDSTTAVYKVADERYEMLKVNAILDKYGMVFVEGGDYKISKKETVKVNSFYIGKYEVTRDLWKAVMGKDVKYDRPDGGKHEPDWVKAYYERMDMPAILYYETAEQFVAKLNKITGKKFRLPTEMEWEYAASGGNKSKGYKYSGSNNPDKVARYEKNSRYHYSFYGGDGYKFNLSRPVPHPVGQLLPNELGIYDMSGNVRELCQENVCKGGYYWSDKTDDLLIKSKITDGNPQAGLRLVLDAE